MKSEPKTNHAGSFAQGGPCQRILDAAERLFSEKGYEATSVRDITQEAGCNLAAVNYHFGNKENLYRQVFIRQFTLIRNQRLAGIAAYLENQAESYTLEGLIRAFAATFLSACNACSSGDGNERERWSQLLSREMLDQRLGSDIFLHEVIVPVRDAFRSALDKVFPGLSEQNVMMCMTSIVGQMMHLHIMHKMFFGINRDNLENMPEHFRNFDLAVDHVANFSAAGIRHILQEQQSD